MERTENEDLPITSMPSFDRVRENFLKRVENEMKINYPSNTTTTTNTTNHSFISSLSSSLSPSSNLFLSVEF